MANIKYASKEKPVPNASGNSQEAIIVHGIRTPKSDFDRRANGEGQAPVTYVGAPSKR